MAFDLELTGLHVSLADGVQGPNGDWKLLSGPETEVLIDASVCRSRFSPTMRTPTTTKDLSLMRKLFLQRFAERDLREPWFESPMSMVELCRENGKTWELCLSVLCFQGKERAFHRRGALLHGTSRGRTDLLASSG